MNARRTVQRNVKRTVKRAVKRKMREQVKIKVKRQVKRTVKRKVKRKVKVMRNTKGQKASEENCEDKRGAEGDAEKSEEGPAEKQLRES